MLGALSVGSTTSCSSDHGRARKVEAEPGVQSGSLRLALSARGESGSLYRLRDAFFQVRDAQFSFFQTFNTEDDPLATNLEATLPVGDFFVDIFGAFALERVEPDGSAVRVTTTLVSPSSQAFRINPNDETDVTFRFETNGEVVEFGQGRLVVQLEVTERAGESRRTVMETSQDALSGLTLRDTLDTALRNAGTTSVAGEDVYHAIIDSYNSAPGRDPSLGHCNDETTAGQPSLNGFPLACPRLEGQQFDNLDSWFPLAFVNRLDLAPTDGAHCGQQRIIFANNNGIGNGRMLMIVEAQIQNPSPECGVSACRPIAEFWESLATVTDSVERGRLLTEAFLSTGVGPFGPFMNARNLGPDGGQIRTNNFNDFQWTLREFHLQAEPVVLPVQTAVAEAPNGQLWDDLSPLPQGEACRDSFLESIPNLLSDNLATLGFPVADACEDAESPNDFSRQNYASHLSSGSGAFAAEIDAQVAGTGLSSNDIANRARFAGSCMGCHIEAGGSFLGNGISAPFSNDFVQVSEQVTEPCTGGGTCFAISEALRTVFLPHRINVQRNFLAAGSACALPAVDAGVPTPAPSVGDAGAPIAALRSGGAPVRTLGGQPFVANAH